ncbi:hypothetical protein ACMATS_34025 [Streptoverticillium reticulum]|uniref:hypothetical protein n=1 Tax=Streptoverticillium reticulum TaxID=1433415 RepID=UPI0039BED45E
MKLTATKRRTARTLAVLGATAAAVSLVGVGPANAVTPHQLKLCNKAGPGRFGPIAVSVELIDRKTWVPNVQSGYCTTFNLTGNGGERAAIWVKPEWTCGPGAWPAETCFPYTPYNGTTNGKLIGILDTKGTDITLTDPLNYTQQ